MVDAKLGEAVHLLSGAAATTKPVPANNDDTNKLRQVVWGWSSQRSQRRKRLNIVLEWLLGMTVLALLGLSGVIYYKKVYLPKLKAVELGKLIAEHAAEARVRANKCRGTTWQTACDALGAAGARRRRNLKTGSAVAVGGGGMVGEEDQTLLFSDDPTVTYDEFCLINYRMKLSGNITFPYHASSHLADGGNYTLALLIQHGAMRNAEQYFCSFKELMQEQGYRDFRDVLVIAPNFNYETDTLVHPNDVFWNASKPWGDWRVGAESDPDCCGNKGRMGTPKTMSSFEVLDHILATLTSRRLFPNLNKISYVGHSAGGQMVQRYAVISVLAALWDMQPDDVLDMKYIIANPSSYTYLTPERYRYNCGKCDCTSKSCVCDQECTVPNHPKLGLPLHHNEGTNHPCYIWNYDRWPYGISSFADKKGHSIPYALRDGDLGVERALRLYGKLHVVYMVGQNDTCNDNLPVCDDSCWKREVWDNKTEGVCWRNDMDTRCPAMLQGPYRRKRGYQYMEYLKTLYGEKTHHLYTVPGVGHNAAGMFSSEIGMRELFA